MGQLFTVQLDASGVNLFEPSRLPCLFLGLTCALLTFPASVICPSGLFLTLSRQNGPQGTKPENIQLRKMGRSVPKMKPSVLKVV
ncbi:hypothetical protein BJX68DRAFT_231152, partial [Aspergillus pseudodeflectus]